MKLHPLYTIFSLIFFAVFMLSNAGGRAGSTNQGNTGAPGDQMSGNNPRTCQSCHATGDIQVTMDLEILDAENNLVTAYIPNEVYTAKVSINLAAGPMPGGYGFQMVSLLDADNSDVNGWTETGHSDNVQIAESTNTNRVYAEHNGVSNTNEFLIQWKAPEAGKGDVSFYAAGNGVNGNGSTSGDGSVTPQKLTLMESVTSGIKNLNSIGIGVHVAPNPVRTHLILRLTSERSENVTIKINNIAGQTFYNQTIRLAKGQQNELLDLNQLDEGIYFLQVTNGSAISTQKIIKL